MKVVLTFVNENTSIAKNVLEQRKRHHDYRQYIAFIKEHEIESLFYPKPKKNLTQLIKNQRCKVC